MTSENKRKFHWSNQPQAGIVQQPRAAGEVDPIAAAYLSLSGQQQQQHPPRAGSTAANSAALAQQMAALAAVRNARALMNPGQAVVAMANSKSGGMVLPQQQPGFAAGRAMVPGMLLPGGAAAGGQGLGAGGDPAAAPKPPDEEENFEEAHDTEAFFNYEPAKFKVGSNHPDPLVQSTSMSSVDPPDVTYVLNLPQKIIDKALLSRPQLETVAYASQCHETLLANGQRRGFFLGDGAGVGKGRQIAGIVFENWLQGRKRHIWLSASADLQYDAQRDLRDIGAGHIACVHLNKLDNKRNIDVPEGVIFLTYSSLIAGAKGGRTRLSQLQQWCGKDFHGCIVFDESHRAKNLVTAGKNKSTKSGQAVADLQESLPGARVVYSSATGASEPLNMAYMTRLGLWGSEGTPFTDFNAFKTAMHSSGVGMMELVAMQLKRSGSYICRTLSYAGCTFETIEDAVAPELLAMYDQSVRLWQRLYVELVTGIDSGKYQYPVKGGKDGEDGEDDNDSLLDEQADGGDEDWPLSIPVNSSPKTVVLRYFWAAHQRFFRSLCVSLKVPCAVAVAKQAINDGKCVVIGLQSTGGSGVDQEVSRGEDITDFISAPAACLKRLVYRCFPLPKMPEAYRQKHATDNGRVAGDKGGKKTSARSLTRKKRGTLSDSDSDFDVDLDVDAGHDFFAAKGVKAKQLVNSDDSSVEFVRETRSTKRAAAQTTDSSSSQKKKLAKVTYKDESEDDEYGEDIEDSEDGEEEDEDGEEEVMSVDSAEDNDDNDPEGEDQEEDLDSRSGGEGDESTFGLDPRRGWVLEGHADLKLQVRLFRSSGSVRYSDPKVVAYLPPHRNNGTPRWCVQSLDGRTEFLEGDDEMQSARRCYTLRLKAAPVADVEAKETVPEKRKEQQSSRTTEAKGTTRPVALPLAASIDDDAAEAKDFVSRKRHRVVEDEEDMWQTAMMPGASSAVGDDGDDEDEDKQSPLRLRGGGEVIVIDSDDDEAPLALGAAQLVPFDPTEELAVYETAVGERAKAFEDIDALGLPGNPLDILINDLGGVTRVAEMTGRKTRLVRTPSGGVRLAKRSENGVGLDKQNIHEKDLFMAGKKLVAIISEAASSGVSLQADKRVANQRQRVHVTLELPWSADRAIQQLGRSHRSNQSSAPHYKLLISPIGGERRFVSAVAKRLESLGALLQGDRRAAVGSNSMSMSNFNFDTKYGKQALTELFNRVFFAHRTTAALPELDDDLAKEVADLVNADRRVRKLVLNVSDEDLDEARLEEGNVSFVIAAQVWLVLVGVDRSSKEKFSVAQFLNRLLGLESRPQRVLFELYIEFHDTIIRDYKRKGTYDLGIMELGSNCICPTPPQAIPIEGSRTNDKAYSIEVSVDRSVSWEDAAAFIDQAEKECAAADAKLLADIRERERRMQVSEERQYRAPLRIVGFYRSKNPTVGGVHSVVAMTEKPSVFEGMASQYLISMRPLTGKNEIARQYARDSFHKISVNEAKVLWLRDLSSESRSRMKGFQIITGNVLALYNHIETAINRHHSGENKLKVRVARAMLPVSSLPEADVSSNRVVNVDEPEERKYLVGILIPSSKYLQDIIKDVRRKASAKPWHSSTMGHVEVRRHLLNSISAYVHSVQPKLQPEHLAKASKKLEETLYQKASSLVEYMDGTSLQRRCHEALKELAAVKISREARLREESEAAALSAVHAPVAAVAKQEPEAIVVDLDSTHTPRGGPVVVPVLTSNFEFDFT